METFKSRLQGLFANRLVFAGSASKGFFLAIGTVAALTLFLIAVVLLSTWVLQADLNSSFNMPALGLDTTWIIAIFAVTLAAGGWIAVGEPSAFVELQFAPSLISVLLALLVARIARSQAHLHSKLGTAIVSSISIGFGFAIGIAIMGLLASGFQSTRIPSLETLFVIGALVSLVGLVASARADRNTPFSSRVTWVLGSTLNYVLFISLASIFLLVTAFLYVLIEPDFA